MEIRPIASALLRNRTGAILVALQIAIALAVIVNAVFLVKQRVDKISRPTGMDVENIFRLRSVGYSRDFDFFGTLEADLKALRAIPGVVAVTPINAVPLSGGGSSTSVFTEPGEKGVDSPANYFEVTEDGLETLGVKLIAGRDFDPNAIERPTGPSSKWVSEVIVTRDLARSLFQEDKPIGKFVYTGNGDPARIVGVVDVMHGAWVGWDKVGHVMLTPTAPYGPGALYLVRTTPGMQAGAMQQAEAALKRSAPGRMLGKPLGLAKDRDRSYFSDHTLAMTLIVVTVLVLAFSALGIFGLAAFNVATRTRQIGTRRAIGARRIDIVRYFLVENWLVTTVGVVLGSALALAVGVWLSYEFELPRLDLYFLVGGVVVVWALGLMAAYQPARRAARVSPSMATRTI
jgi:putative ABC transport system permease protein